MLLDYPSIGEEQQAYFFDADDSDMFTNLYQAGNYTNTQQHTPYQGGGDFEHYNAINTESRSPQQQMMTNWTPTSASSGTLPDWQGQVNMGSYIHANNQQANNMAYYNEPADEYANMCSVTQEMNRMPIGHQWMRSSTYRFNPSTGKTRTKDKYRVVYTDHQRLELEKEFRYSRYITIRRKSELASSLGLSERQVKIWFQNRRAKERKQAKKQGEPSHEPTEKTQEAAKHTTSYMQMVEYPDQKELTRNLPTPYRILNTSTTIIKEEPLSNQSQTSSLKSL